MPELLLVPVAFLALTLSGLWIWMIVDCATKEQPVGNTKIAWILVIVLAGWVGALIYYFYRRPRRIREQGDRAREDPLQTGLPSG